MGDTPLEDKLVDYAEVCNAEKEIADKKKTLKAEIEEELGQSEAKIETPAGKFTMVATSKWTYSDKCKEMTEDVKILQEDEKEDGTATKIETFGLRFNAAKQK